MNLDFRSFLGIYNGGKSCSLNHLVSQPCPLFLLILNCEKCKDFVISPKGNDVYTQLDYNSFFKEPYEIIADSLAGILNVKPIEFNQIIQNNYEYLATDNAKITVAVYSDNGKAFSVEYFLKWRGESDEWSYDSTKVDSMIYAILPKMSIYLNGTEQYEFNKFGGRIGDNIFRWYEIDIYQTFRDSLICQPFLHAQIESNTGKINNIKINQWYKNLADVKEILSTDSLKIIAKNYFLACDEVLSIPDNLTNYGYCIKYDRLCNTIGPAIIDEYGSELYVLIDVQNGEIIGSGTIDFD